MGIMQHYREVNKPLKCSLPVEVMSKLLQEYFEFKLIRGQNFTIVVMGNYEILRVRCVILQVFSKFDRC